jgi:hypothetical protein
MFQCERCRKESHDDDAGSINAALIAFWYVLDVITLTFDPIPYKRVCKNCAKKANAILFGLLFFSSLFSFF